MSVPAVASSSPPRSATTRILSRALWFGLLAGVVEGIVPLVQKLVFGRMRIHASPHLVWMAPLAEAMLFLLVGLGLALVVRLLPRRLADRWVALATTVLAAGAVWSVTLLYPQLYSWAALLLAIGAGVQLGGWSDSPRLDRLIARSLVPLGAVVGLVAIAMIVAPRVRESRAFAALPAPREGAPNVVLLILDTVRAQSLTLHGATRPTSPRLQALGSQGVVFDYALSTAPWTLPSHASMFTGRYPHELTADWLTPLDDTTRTLAEELAGQGYATAGFTGNYMVSWEVGLSRGFEHYEDYRLSAAQLLLSSASLRKAAYWPRLRRALGRYDSVNRKRAPSINDDVLAWLDTRPDRPFFAFVNYMDAHEMYNPPAPYRASFGPDTARKNALTAYGLGGLGYRTGKAKMTPVEVQAELDAYEESIAALDEQVGRLVDSLDARGLRDNTVIIVSSDHGEHFGEHGRFEHASSLYPQLLHVPLLMRGPSRIPAGRRVPDFVTLRDLAATILAVGPGIESLPGRSLARFWDSTGVATAREESPIIGSITNGFWTERSKPTVRKGMRSVLIDGAQVIEDVRDPTTFELFDLRLDPLGRTDLAADSTRLAAVAAGRQFLGAVQWRSLSREVARKAGEIGAPQD
jgi:arylsulfatase A-like enzyme